MPEGIFRKRVTYQDEVKDVHRSKTEVLLSKQHEYKNGYSYISITLCSLLATHERVTIMKKKSLLIDYSQQKPILNSEVPCKITCGNGWVNMNLEFCPFRTQSQHKMTLLASLKTSDANPIENMCSAMKVRPRAKCI